MPLPSNFEDSCTIISVVPVPIHEKKPGLLPGEYIIPAVQKPMEDVELLHVVRGKFPVYIDENRPALIVPEPSDRICASIIRDYTTAIAGYEPGKAEPGLTFMRGALSKEEALDQKPLLKQIRTLQNNWFKNLVALADDDWSKFRMRRMIPGLAKVACSQLGLTREWNLDVEIAQIDALNLTHCKFCRSQIHQEALVCPNCQGILNPARYEKEFISARTIKTVDPLLK
jgi:hypothetical protein